MNGIVAICSLIGRGSVASEDLRFLFVCLTKKKKKKKEKKPSQKPCTKLSMLSVRLYASLSSLNQLLTPTTVRWQRGQEGGHSSLSALPVPSCQLPCRLRVDTENSHMYVCAHVPSHTRTHTWGPVVDPVGHCGSVALYH